MKYFSELFTALDESNKTNDKVAALIAYFKIASAEDAAWAVALLSGRRPKRPVNSTKVWNWAVELSGLPDWLWGESYDAVGDLSETLALLLPSSKKPEDIPLHEWMNFISSLSGMPEPMQKAALIDAWNKLEKKEVFLFNKLIGGSFRVGVSSRLVIKAIAKVAGLEEKVISHRLMGSWYPDKDFFQNLIQTDVTDTDISRPYPFYLAYALDLELQDLGEIKNWQAEWKWDGIRSQLIKRNSEVFLWTRGEELVTDRYPEIASIGRLLPDGTAIDGELLAWKNGKPMSFALLQQRIGRKTIGKKLLNDVPVSLVAYDILEWKAEDIREKPLIERRKLLSDLVIEMRLHDLFILSPSVIAESWEELRSIRSGSREMGAEGFMLKKLDSPYLTGRKKGDWWKWKVDPFLVDAVLIYAQRGSGKRASLYTDYTFGIWNEERKLVPFAKAYSGLTDEEIRKVDAFIRKNTLEKFGPVRTVKAALVFELAFEAIQLSSRHKSGVAVRFPRINRWRIDKRAEDADTLENIRMLLKAEGAS